jgi:RNA polymerase sigma-70 factor, ECF subfamily
VLSGGSEHGMGSDDDQWTVWLDQHIATLILLARQWVSSRADAEDVVQEAFIRFWRSRLRVSDPAAYFYACVKHVALDWHRNQRRRTTREEAAARLEPAPFFAGPFEQSERRVAIEAALRELPESQREVLVMKIWGAYRSLRSPRRCRFRPTRPSPAIATRSPS